MCVFEMYNLKSQELKVDFGDDGDHWTTVIVSNITNSGGGLEQVYRTPCPERIGTQLTRTLRGVRCHEDQL